MKSIAPCPNPKNNIQRGNIANPGIGFKISTVLLTIQRQVLLITERPIKKKPIAEPSNKPWKTKLNVVIAFANKVPLKIPLKKALNIAGIDGNSSTGNTCER